MRDFAYGRAASVGAASRAVAEKPGATYIAGGTSLLDLMKEDVERPSALVDLNGLPLAAITPHAGGLRLGGLATNADVAKHPLVQAAYPALSEALLSGASPQLRHMATVGGNLLQRTRCPYFRDTGFDRCNKRMPGSGCAAREGWHRNHAVLGISDACIATHPSDMAVALAMLGATIHVEGPQGARDLPMAGFHLPPGSHPERETVLRPGDLITYVDLPALPFASRSRYLKVRDRASYEFALTSAAVALDVTGGRIQAARVALGGVGTVPWRSPEAEAALVGQAPTEATYMRAAQAALANASPGRDNQFKVELARRTLVRALLMVEGAGA